MVIKRSSGQEVQALIAELSADDEVRRETAIARLAVIGTRAVDRLVAALAIPTPGPIRVSALRALESIGDLRALGPVLSLLSTPDPEVAVAAVGAARAFLHSKRSTEVLDALVTMALDPEHPAAARLAALDALDDMGSRVLDPLWQRLEADADLTVSRRAARERGQPDPLGEMEAMASGALPGDPAVVGGLLEMTATDVPLATLHKLVTAIRQREAQERTASARAAWLSTRGAVHLVLANRESRVALYDLRETIETTAVPLPAEFAKVAVIIGDAQTLEAIAAAASHAGQMPDASGWLDDLRHAFRAIAEREHIGPRHAVTKRIQRKFPKAAEMLIGRGAGGSSGPRRSSSR